MTPEDKEIEKLKAQIERLESAKKRTAEFSVREDTYQGHPILFFHGPLLTEPFSIGVKGLLAIRACWKNVSDFLDKYESKKLKDIEEEEDKI